VPGRTPLMQWPSEARQALSVSTEISYVMSAHEKRRTIWARPDERGVEAI